MPSFLPPAWCCGTCRKKQASFHRPVWMRLTTTGSPNSLSTMLLRQGQALMTWNYPLISDSGFPASRDKRTSQGYPQCWDLTVKGMSVLSLCRVWTQAVQVQVWFCHLLTDWSWANRFPFLCLGLFLPKNVNDNSKYFTGLDFLFVLVAVTLAELSFLPLDPQHGWPGVFMRT